MRAFLLQHLGSLRSKYWLVPASMAVAAIVVSFLVVELDRRLGIGWIDDLPLLYANEPAGARALLSTIAGSMITVAGVTFSITIAALATTAATFGPRLITNFMEDRGNQITLGTFIGTFLYCLLVLRTVQSGEDQAAVFVPHLAVLVALLFAIASIGVLIYFIHHIPESIHISNVVASLGRRMHQQVEQMFPDALGEPARGGEDDGADGRLAEETVALHAEADGYLQYVDTDLLMKHAIEHDLFIHLTNRPGDFVGKGRVVARIAPRDGAGQEVLGPVRRAVIIGDYQSSAQDLLYVINRLVEVAARALSPGMNDIFTATNAIDWLGGGLASLAGRAIPEDLRRDERGELRVAARSRTFEEIAGAVFDQLRPYAAADRNAGTHLMRVLAATAGDTMDLQRRAVLLTHAKALHHAAREAIHHPRDVALMEEAYGDAVAALSAPRPVDQQVT